MVYGYIFLFIALICGAVKGACGKKTSGFVESYSDAMFINLIRMLFCTAVGIIMIAAGSGLSSLKIDKASFFITLMSALATSGFVVFWLICIKNGAYVMMDVFLTLCVAVPLIGCRIAYGEEIRINQWVGFVMLIFAAYQMCRFNNGIKQKLTPKIFILFILCGLSNGFAQFSQKIFIKSIPGGSIAVFNFYTYLFSAAILFALFVIFKKAGERDTKTCNPKRIIGYIAVMAVCLFLNSFFQTKSGLYLTSAQIYPFAQGGGLILSVLMSWLLFKETPDKKCISGVIIAFAALIIMNML